MAGFRKECKYCQKEIKLSNQIGNKWIPYDLDGNPHDCKNREKLVPELGPGTETLSQYQEQGPEKYTLEQVVRKLQSLGISVDLKRLMTTK
jgi:hypothetical protein